MTGLSDITNEFGSIRIALDETNKNREAAVPKTPTRAGNYPSSSYAPVSPYSDNDNDESLNPCDSPCLLPKLNNHRGGDDVVDTTKIISHAPSSPSSHDTTSKQKSNKQAIVSEHKKAELAGRFLEEPLLKDNPNRFVLFPIEDNEVSFVTFC